MSSRGQLRDGVRGSRCVPRAAGVRRRGSGDRALRANGPRPRIPRGGAPARWMPPATAGSPPPPPRSPPARRRRRLCAPPLPLPAPPRRRRAVPPRRRRSRSAVRRAREASSGSFAARPSRSARPLRAATRGSAVAAKRLDGDTGPDGRLGRARQLGEVVGHRLGRREALPPGRRGVVQADQALPDDLVLLGDRRQVGFDPPDALGGARDLRVGRSIRSVSSASSAPISSRRSRRGLRAAFACARSCSTTASSRRISPPASPPRASSGSPRGRGGHPRG